MEKYLRQGIKPIISEFPVVGKILDEYKIGCTSCAIGSCLLQDVVGIHNLSPELEAELLYNIEKAIYPGRQVEKPKIRRAETRPAEITYSPPVAELVDEHKVIKRWLALIPPVIEELNNDPDAAWQWIRQGVDLIRNYADRYHHAKEEDILFKYVDENLEIIQTMYEEHEIGRNHVRAAVEAAEAGDQTTAGAHLNAYRELLQEHIRKEDEILYPWIDRDLTDTQVGELFAKFRDANRKAEEGCPEKYLKFVEELEYKLK